MITLLARRAQVTHHILHNPTCLSHAPTCYIELPFSENMVLCSLFCYLQYSDTPMLNILQLLLPHLWKILPTRWKRKSKTNVSSPSIILQLLQGKSVHNSIQLESQCRLHWALYSFPLLLNTKSIHPHLHVQCTSYYPTNTNLVFSYHATLIHPTVHSFTT